MALLVTSRRACRPDERIAASIVPGLSGSGGSSAAYSVFHIRVSSSGLERILPHQLDDAGNRIIRPATRLRAARYGVPGRIRYRAHCAYLTPSPCCRCGCRAGRKSRRSHGAGAFAPGRWTTRAPRLPVRRLARYALMKSALVFQIRVFSFQIYRIATPHGPLPAGIVATTAIVSASTTDTSPDGPFAV